MGCWCEGLSDKLEVFVLLEFMHDVCNFRLYQLRTQQIVDICHLKIGEIRTRRAMKRGEREEEGK